MAGRQVRLDPDVVAALDAQADPAAPVSLAAAVNRHLRRALGLTADSPAGGPTGPQAGPLEGPSVPAGGAARLVAPGWPTRGRTGRTVAPRRPGR